MLPAEGALFTMVEHTGAVLMNSQLTGALLTVALLFTVEEVSACLLLLTAAWLTVALLQTLEEVTVGLLDGCGLASLSDTVTVVDVLTVVRVELGAEIEEAELTPRIKKQEADKHFFR